MKTYKKPLTEVHDIEVVVMQATSPGLDIKTENVSSNDDVLGKETSFPSNSIWDEEE